MAVLFPIDIYRAARAAMAGAASVALVASIVPALAQAPSPVVGVPHDWSHRHMIFSRPASQAQDRRLASDPRYWQQGDVRYGLQPTAADAGAYELAAAGAASPAPRTRRGPVAFKRDWAMSLPSTAAVGSVGAGQFPAKYVFDVDAPPSCADDFVVANTGLAQVASVAASRTGTFTTSGPIAGQTATIGGTVVLTASGTPGTGTISVATTYCALPGQGVTVGGVSLTTNATVDVWTVTMNTPAINDTVTIGGVTYTFVAAGTGVLPTANNVHVGGSNAATAQNLYAALNAVAANCATANCFGTGTVANPKGTATWTAGNAFITATAKCAGAAPFTLAVTDTGGSRITSSHPTTGANGTTSGTNFALNANNATLATNIATAINTNTATGAVAAASAGDVTLSGANSVTLAQNFVSGVTLSGATLTGGTTGTNTGLFFAIDGTALTAATNLAAAITRNGAGPGVAATSVGAVVTVTATTAGTTGNGVTLAETMSRFSWAGGSLAGGVNAVPALVAYNQLYSTQGTAGGLCNQDGPSVMWSYQTAVQSGAVAAMTGPVLSLDGTKVAFVATSASGAVLHVLKWKAGQGTTPALAPAPDQTLAPGADWSACTAGNSCVATIALNGNPQSTRSAPYYDYVGDALYVGDNSGRLHKFTGVFGGAPAEATTGWPITVHSGAFTLTGAVYDYGSGNIFVGDSGGQLSFVRETGSTVGACASGVPPCLGSVVQALGGAIVDAPIVDGTTGRVLAFEGTDGTTRGAVFQFDTGLTAGSQRRVSVGSGTTGSGYAQSYIYAGTFDEAYFQSADGTGYLYVCGKVPQGNNRFDSPALHRIAMTAGVMNTVSDGFLTLTTVSGEECSPVTEIMNGSTEWLFFSVGDNGGFPTGASACPSGATGCIMSLNLTALGGTWPPAGVTAAVPAPIGPTDPVTNTTKSSTSAIVVDNVSPAAQASSIYFSYTSAAAAAATCNGATGGGCMLKLTQAGLQ